MRQANFNQIAAYLLGFFCGWPIFYDVISAEMVAIEFDQNNITAGLEGGAPIPLGFFSLVIYLSLFVFPTKEFRALIPKLASQLAVLGIIFFDIGILRIIAIIAPIFGFYALNIADKNSAETKKFADGFLMGITAFYALNIFSYIIVQDVGNFDISGAAQVFGYEIYQFFVSYSAVASLVFGMSYLLCLANKSDLRYSKYSLFILAVLSAIIVIFAYRKAALADVLFVTILSATYIFFRLSRGKINKGAILLPILIVFAYHSYLFFESIRDISFDASIDQREGAYFILINELVSLDVVGFLFGYKTGFGGYSNLFIDLFVRGGVIGLFVYFYFLICAVYKYFRSMITMLRARAKTPIIFAYTLIFVLFSVLVGNIFNLNLVVPYFFVNLIALLLVFSSAFKTASRKYCSDKICRRLA